jgi:hypothetical protein
VILGTVAATAALEFAGIAIVVGTGNHFVLKNVDWISSIGGRLGLPILAIHVLAVSLILLFASTFLKVVSSAYLDRTISWDNWRIIRPDFSLRCT